MRKTLTLVGVWLLAATLPAARADDHGTRLQVDRIGGGTAIRHEVEGGDEGSSEPASTPRRRRAAVRPVARRFYAKVPQMSKDPEGNTCIGVERRAFDSEADAVLRNQAEEQRWARLSKSYVLCQGATAPETSPTALASQYWRQVGEDDLPRPAPRIAPGYMLAGKVAYLEANTSMAERFSHATPLGPLTIDATGQLFVDWGDGTGTQGPFDHPGGPWPNGTITHAWTTAGHYDVVVTQRWTATWNLAGASGRLAGLATEGRIDDFEVRQLQAVRNR